MLFSFAIQRISNMRAVLYKPRRTSVEFIWENTTAIKERSVQHCSAAKITIKFNSFRRFLTV